MRALARGLLLLFFVPFAHAAIIATTATGTGYSASAAVTAFTLNLPSSVNAGDLLLVQININTASITASAPTGWTQLRVDTNSGSGSDNRQYIYYRFAIASDTAGTATSWGLSSAAVVTASMVGFRSDLGGRNVVLGSNSANTGNNTSPTGATVTASGPSMLVRFFGQAYGTSTFSSSGLTRLVSTTSAGTTAGSTLLTAARAIASAGATGADAVTASNSGRWIVQTLLLTESQLNKPTSCYADTFSDSATFGQNWVTTSVGSTAFTPTITGGRLRLTSNTGYISTAASLQRLFPTSNLIYVEFNYYAYNNSSGADGIAVTLSDASITPQPGGFGGSLGYAQRSDSGGINGFAGGWMSVGIDEYGNYSNPTEGRVGGPGFLKDSIAIRGSGSGQSGYAYVAGTAGGLSIDSSSSPGPGDRYRIVIDVASATQTYVTVDRDNTARNGSAYANLIPTFNIQAAGSQAAIPSNLMLSFTGSTGGSSNVHEIGNLQVCASNLQTTNQVDHFEILHDGQGLTCEPENVTIRACADAACSTLMSVPVSVTLAPTGAGWVGGNVQTINGSAVIQLRQTTAATVPIDITNSTPGSKPFSVNRCNGANMAANTHCDLAFANAGLEFDVLNVLANKPSGAVRLRAVKNSGDASNSCVALFENTTQSINFWSTYTTPTTGTRAVELRAGSGSGVFTSIGQTAATATAIPLVFNNAGETTFEARYNDAGLLLLNAQYNGSGDYAGLVLSGADSFVSKPAGLCVAPTPTPTACTSSYNQCAPYVAAGMPFQLRITGAGWESDTDTDFCANNNTTPNYNQIVPLTPLLVAPSGGTAGALASYSGAFNPASVAITGGTANLTDLIETEVGVFRFVATPPTNGYFNQTVGAGQSQNVGRFMPYRFEVSSTGAIRNGTSPWSCPFTYQEQPFGFDYDTATGTDYSPVISITALNARNQTTLNFDAGGSGGDDTNSFWKLASTLAHTYTHVPPPTAGGALLQLSSATVTPLSGTQNNNDGARSYRLSGETFSYARGSAPNAPFGASLQLGVTAAALTQSPAASETYLDPNNLTATDQACYRGGCPTNTTTICTNACSAFTSSPITDRNGSALDIRYGRLRLNSASGPADTALALPVTAEYWDGTTFVVNNVDNCTAINGAGAALSNYQNSLSSGETVASGNAALINGVSSGASGALILSAPGVGNEGRVDVFLNLLAGNVFPWLQYDWDGNAGTAATGPTATASFGLFRGSDRVIYWQETQ